MVNCDLNFKIFRVRIFTLFVLILLSTSLYSVDVVSIYDIQYTEDPGFDGTFPSLYVGQTVIVQGVVTATGFNGGRVFIGEQRGGPWTGIAVDGIGNRVSVGDLIEVQGRVSEIMGKTVITNTRNLRTLLSNQTLPNPVRVSVHEALTSEAFESVLVQLTNVTCRSLSNGNFIAIVEDGSAGINIGNGFSKELSNLFRPGDNYSSILGIIDFSFNQFSIHPRNHSDIRSDATGIQTRTWGVIKSLYR
jgi:predicted extracellular nuclease